MGTTRGLVSAPTEVGALHLTLGRLGRDHPDVPAGVLVEALDRAHRALDGARVRAYVPVLIEKQVRRELDAVRRTRLRRPAPGRSAVPERRGPASSWSPRSRTGSPPSVP